MREVEEIVREALSITGLVSEAELLCLAKWASKVPKVHDIVEIGSYCGRSASVLAGVSNSRVVCVDIWDEHPTKEKYRNAETTFRETMREKGLSNRVVAHRGKSQRVARWLTDRVSKGEELILAGLIFIDGSHKYFDVKTDFVEWKGFLAEKGILAFHDYNEEVGYGKGVVKLVNELLYSNEWILLERVETLAILQKRINLF